MRKLGLNALTRRHIMSIWWVLGAFWLGGTLGVLLYALMSTAKSARSAGEQAFYALEGDTII